MGEPCRQEQHKAVLTGLHGGEQALAQLGKELLHILSLGSFPGDRSLSHQHGEGLSTHPLHLPLLSEPSILSIVRVQPSLSNYFK